MVRQEKIPLPVQDAASPASGCVVSVNLLIIVITSLSGFHLVAENLRI